MTPRQRREILERCKKLFLLGFNKDEIKPIIEVEFKLELTNLDWDLLYGEMRDGMKFIPDVQDIKAALGETWGRSRLLQSDLLQVYQTMLRNYEAHMQGLREHPDGTPVISVRPLDLAAMAEKLSKFDQERVTSMMNVSKALALLEPPPSVSVTSLPTTPSALMAGLADEAEDADFESSDP